MNKNEEIVDNDTLKVDHVKQKKTSLRQRADIAKTMRCKNLIAVIEYPNNLINIGSIIRNVNALGVEKVYIVTPGNIVKSKWQEMRNGSKLNAVSASAIKWTFVKKFNNTENCLDHLEKNGFVSIVTSPHIKGRENIELDKCDYTKFKKLAVWFGNESAGISSQAVDRSKLCVSIPMAGIIESLNLGTASGIVLYEITKQRRQFNKLKKKI